jgi:parvulin-like peptidyl-prolyl isomerase
MVGVGIVGILVISLVAYGLYQVNFVQPDQPVAVVNGEPVLTRTFRSRVRLAQWNLITQYDGILDLLEVVGDDPQTRSTYQVQLDNINQQLVNPLFIGSSILELLIQEALVEQEAEQRGITVTEAEVDTWLEESFGFFGEPTPAPSAVPVNGTPSPTATPYTRALYEANLDAFLTNVGSYGVDEAALRSDARARLYRDRLSQAFEAEVDRTQDQVWARHILVGEEDEALDLLESIQSGEEWEGLAAEFSTDASNRDQGGDLGWFARGMMVEPFEEAAFEGEIGEIVGPIETDFGWHLIEVLGHEMRELEDGDFQRAVAAYFEGWLTETSEAATIDVKEYWIDRIPSVRLPGS